jgi:5,10-methylenetetrahydromethanopterin reductase
LKIGVFVSDTGGDRTGVEEVQRRARWVEENGFTSAWVPQIPWSLDALTALTLAAAVTERIELGTAVVPTYPRHPLALAQQALSVQVASNGRLTLGIGPSHPVVVESMHGLSYARPYTHTREYVEVLERAMAGPGQVHFEGTEYRVNALLDVPGATPVPILIAALAPKMLALAGSRTEGTITWMADERSLAEHVVPKLVAAALDAGRATSRVVAGVLVAVCDDEAEGRERAARLFSVYGQIPTYARILATGDSTDPAEVCVVGTESQVRARLESYRDAGATDLAAATFAVGDDRPASLRRTHELLASLAPEL